MPFTDNSTDTPKELNQVYITLASPKDIMSWSSGEVENFSPNAVNGLSYERIFGPEYKKVCRCGFYDILNNNTGTCALCGSRFRITLVRHRQMGHIELAVPVTHIWFYSIGLMLDLTARDLDRVIYYTDYILINPKGVAGFKRGQIITEEEYEDLIDDYGDEAPDAGTGAGALQRLLATIDMAALIDELSQDIGKTDSKQDNRKIVKRLQLAQGFRDSGINPECLILNILPVIPPDLRSLGLFSKDCFAKKGLDELYGCIICSNNRLKKHDNPQVPEGQTRIDLLKIQTAVDAIFGNERGSRHRIGASNRPLREIYNMIQSKGDSSCLNLLNKQIETLVDRISSMYAPSLPQEFHDDKHQRGEQRVQAYKKLVQACSAGESNTLNVFQMLVKQIQGLGLNVFSHEHSDHSDGTLATGNFFNLLAEIELMEERF